MYESDEFYGKVDNKKPEENNKNSQNSWIRWKEYATMTLKFIHKQNLIWIYIQDINVIRLIRNMTLD
jgi:hypothetical protein